MPFVIGTRLGSYEILAPLGAGGMGEVYRAREARLDRDVAIKVLPEVLFENRERRERFEREAKLLAAVSHPNIAAIYAFEEVSGRHLLVQELLEGESLRQTISHGPVSLKKALDVAAQVAEGLAAAHGKGIVHRDLKPENVFLTTDGHAKLLDFGLARHDASAAGASDTKSPTLARLTEPGVVFGTVAYMSPEQARGESVDYRTDQFSLGVVLYEMLTGRRPFEGTSAAEVMAGILRDEPEAVTKLGSNLPSQVGWLVQRLLSKGPEERYSSSKDLAKELRTLRTHLSEAGSAAGVKPGEELSRGRRIPIRVAALPAALVVAFGLYLAVRFLRPAPPSARPLNLTLSFPGDAAPFVENRNPLALSPDGKTLVYAGSRGGTTWLFVRPLDRDEVRPMPGTEGATFPFFSPDGQWVGFFAEKKLWKVALAGGAPIALCDAPNRRGGSWGADGTIVFVPTPTGGLHRIAVSGGEPKVVTAPDAARNERHYFPEVLPDGENVLFGITYGGTRWEVAAVSLRTGKLRTILENAATPRYLPTGHLVFVRDGMYMGAPFSLERLEITGPPVPLLEDLFTNRNGMKVAALDFAQDGTLVYVPYRVPQRTLVWVDRKGAEERVPLPPGGYWQIALSPDGTRLAAAATGKSEDSFLLVGDLVRGTLTRSGAEGFVWANQAWTPDGQRIAFSLLPEGRTFPGVFWQRADGGGPAEPLVGETALRQDHPTSFSPDGGTLLFQAASLAPVGQPRGFWEFFVFPLRGDGKPRPILSSKSLVLDPQFSRDGRWIAYFSDESGRYEVYVQPYPDPGPKWQVSNEGGELPVWSWDGRELFYRWKDQVLAVDVETRPTFRAGRPRKLFEGSYFRGDVQEANKYDVARDGKRFLMIKPDPEESGPAHVKVVLNWFEEVKRRMPKGG